MPEQKIIYINSAVRDNGGTDNNFTITATGDSFRSRPKSVKLVTANIPFSWFNITSTNNVIRFVEAGPTNYDVTIAPGNYTASTLASAIQAAKILLGGGNPTVTYDPNTLKMTFSENVNFQLDFTVPNNMAIRVGFTPGTVTASALSVISPNAVQMIVDNDIYVCSDLVGGNDNGIIPWQPSLNSNPQVIASIPVVAGFGGIITYIAPTDIPEVKCAQSLFSRENSSINSNTYNKINFYLQFPSGFGLDLRGAHWTAQLVFTF